MKDFFASLLTEKNFNLVMSTAVAIILIVPVGMACVYLGFIKGESACSADTNALVWLLWAFKACLW